jgi:hypothetical protein
VAHDAVLWVVVCLALVGCTPPRSLQASSIAQPGGISVRPLLGSTPAILDAEFGRPALRRVDGPAQVWLYQASSCGLNLILYPDGNGVPRVASATTLDGSPTLGDCPIHLSQLHDLPLHPAHGAAASALE